MSYLVSIIVPIYKVEKYIERCILSLLHQNCYGALIECILVDDCSPDKSMLIAKDTIRKFGGSSTIDFKFLRCIKNEGVSVARNLGIQASKGKYLFFLDSDDYLTKDCFKIFLKKLEQYPQVEMLMGNNRDERTNKAYINPRKIPNKLIDNNLLMELYYSTNIPVMAWNSMILADIIKKNNLSFKPGILFEDMLWASQLYQFINSFVFISDITLIYENNPQSIMNTRDVNFEKYVWSNKIILEDLLSVPYKEHEVSNTLYIVSHLLNVLDVISKHDKLNYDVVQDIIRYRSFIIKRSLKNGRIILFLFDLLLYRPFNYLVGVRLFRKNFSRILEVVRFVASCFDFLHIYRSKKYIYIGCFS